MANVLIRIECAAIVITEASICEWAPVVWLGAAITSVAHPFSVFIASLFWLITAWDIFVNASVIR